jgi:hypothetical protein
MEEQLFTQFFSSDGVLRWAPALSMRFRSREREAKNRARKREEKRARKKESVEAKRKKRVLVFFPLFAAGHWKPGSRA